MLELLIEAILEALGLESPKKQQQRQQPRRRAATPATAPVEKPPAPQQYRPSPQSRPAPAARRVQRPPLADLERILLPRDAAPAQPAGGEDFIAKLRNNPAAAREAFVYSEIFGRPLGDRR